MWTMECNDHGHGNLTPRPPLVPWLICTTTTTKSCLFSVVPNSPCFCTRNPNSLSWKNHLIGEVSNDCGKRVINSMPLVSKRWNPTPEQLRALEEMYKRGTRTPSAQQIQQIAAKLRRFGRIEGKNVFYWFQNHKARERQKKRRQIELQAAGIKNRHDQNKLERKPTGLSRRYFGIEHPKILHTPSSCSTLSEEAECSKKDGWKLQQQVITTGKNETCWKLDLSSCINNHTVQTITAQRTRGQESADPFTALDHTILLPSKNNDFRIIESGVKESPTLQLFPNKSIDFEETQQDVSMGGTKFAPNEFIEFLPTKN